MIRIIIRLENFLLFETNLEVSFYFSFNQTELSMKYSLRFLVLHF